VTMKMNTAEGEEDGVTERWPLLKRKLQKQPASSRGLAAPALQEMNAPEAQPPGRTDKGARRTPALARRSLLV